MNLQTLRCFGTAFVIGAWLLPHSSFAGSFYSRYGIGLPLYRDGVKAVSMGGVSIAISDSVSLNFLNPATLASVTTTHIQGDFLYDRATISLGATHAKFHDANVNGLGILIPVKRGYVVSFGIQPYSQVDYDFTNSGRVGEQDYSEILSGSGGVDNFYFAVAGTSGPVRAGLAVDLYFGMINKAWRVNYSSGDYLYSRDEISTNFQGSGMHGGVHWSGSRWQIGAAVGASSSLTVKTRVDSRFRLDQDPTKSKARLPLWCGLGLAYQAAPQWLFAAQWRGQQWSSVSRDQLLGAQGVDSHILGGGVEFSPLSERGAEMIKRVYYRAGATWSRLPYLDEVTGHHLTEWTVTAGLGLPFNRGDSRLDFAVEFGHRGSKSGTLAAENIFRISASVIGSERWFQRR